MLSRRLYFLLTIPVWAGMAFLVYWNWTRIVLKGTTILPSHPGTVAVVEVLLAALFLLFALSKIGDLITSDPLRDGTAPTPEQLRAKADKEAKQALKADDKAGALAIYEKAGMNLAAMPLAQELGDRAAMARLYTKLGRYMQARKLYVELCDYLSAAHVSGLMNDIEAARSFYSRVAHEREACGDTNVEAAGLWDRAGDRAKAALLYEDCGELELAAECYEMVGDEDNAKRCIERTATIRTFERRKTDNGVRPIGHDRRTENIREDLAKSAQLFERMGDYFEAGMNWRRIGQFDKAAASFEKFEEWDRAADCYLADGENAKAKAMRQRLAAAAAPHTQQPAQPHPISQQTAERSSPEPIPEQPEDNAESAMPAGTPAALVNQDPGTLQSAPPARFIPISQSAQEPVPIFFVPKSGQTPVARVTQPASHLQVVIPQLATDVRRGNFKAAAEQTLAAHEWLLAAALFEQAGDRLRAAELYREIGRIDEAISCLQKAGRLRDAAMLELGLGRRDRAIAILLQSDNKKSDSAVAYLLAELLVMDRRHSEAVGVLNKSLAPEGVTEQNAGIHFEFARLLARSGAKREAVQALRKILAAGAQSPEIEKLILDLAPTDAQAKSIPSAPAKSKPEPKAPPPKVTARDFLMAAINAPVPSNKAAESTTEPPPETKEKPTFVFNPATDEKKFSGAALKQLEVSLFGRPDAGVLPGKSAPTAQLAPAKLAPSQPGTRVATAPVSASDPFSMEKRYHLVRELARGEKGIVFEATDRVLGRAIALKLLQNTNPSTERIQQFLLEARAIARLTQPNIIAIYDVGLIELKHYIAMELVRGGSMKDLIAEEKNLQPKEAMRIFVEMARGLQAAHEAGILHGDIKPGNVLLTPSRDVKIVDFGLSKLTEDTSAATGNAASAPGAGTPGYMSPEQIRGEVLSPACDIYALGIALYTMLVGVPPSSTAGRMNRSDITQFTLAGKLPRLTMLLPEIPEPIEQLYEYCTAANPAERYQAIEDFLPSAQQMYDAL